VAAVIAGGVLAGMTVAQLVSMGASAAAGTLSIIKIVEELHKLGLGPHQEIPPEHHPAIHQALAQCRAAGDLTPLRPAPTPQEAHQAEWHPPPTA
jgi:hypothetical protein